ncbi:hypothetical protein ACOME3_009925 [Neoechinorhynchus agilis]
MTNFKRFGLAGVRAHKVESCFTTVTLPNHFSLVTGLYEDEHGIVSNEIFDPDTKKVFTMKTASNSEEFWWTQNPSVTPIWTANQLETKRGPGEKVRRSGVIGWAGHHVPFHGRLPDKHLGLDSIKDFRKRLHVILNWFTYNMNPINFGCVYFDEPDHVGHEHGPFSVETGKTLKRLDEIIGFLDEELEDIGLRNELNVVIVSDHGMTRVNNQDLLESSAYKAYGTTTVLNIFPSSEDMTDKIYNNLSNKLGVRIYRRDQLAKYHHYSYNKRIAPLVLVADLGYIIHRTHQSRTRDKLEGQHGYDQREGSMHTIFLARGPAFKPGQTVSEMRLVDIYPILRTALRISNTSLPQRFEHLMINPMRNVSVHKYEDYQLIGLTLMTLALFCAFCVPICKRARFDKMNR